VGMEFQKVSIDQGFDLYVAPTDKFKTTWLKLVLRRSLNADEHSLNAVLPFVLRRGTRRHPTARDIARCMEELYGAQFGADVGKIGETQQIELGASVADEQFLPERIGSTEKVVAFLAEALLDPALENGVFRAEYVTQEAEILRRRIESLINDRRRYAVNRLREEMCKDEPFGLNAYGDVEQLRRVTPEGLYEHYRHVLETSPVDMFVVGPVDPDEAAAMVRRHFRLPRGRIRQPGPVVVRTPGKERTVVEHRDVQQGVLVMGLRTGVRYPDDDYPALQVYNGILGAFPHSKLFVNVRERASLAYYTWSQLEGTKGVMMITAGIAVEKYRQALGIVREQLEAVAAGDVTDAELEQTKKGLINALLSGRDSPSRIMGSRLLGIINGRLRPVDEHIEELKAVTVEDVRRVAARVRPDTIYFLRSPEGNGPDAAPGPGAVR